MNQTGNYEDESKRIPRKSRVNSVRDQDYLVRRNELEVTMTEGGKAYDYTDILHNFIDETKDIQLVYQKKVEDFVEKHTELKTLGQIISLSICVDNETMYPARDYVHSQRMFDSCCLPCGSVLCLPCSWTCFLPCYLFSIGNVMSTRNESDFIANNIRNSRCILFKEHLVYFSLPWQYHDDSVSGNTHQNGESVYIWPIREISVNVVDDVDEHLRNSCLGFIHKKTTQKLSGILVEGECVIGDNTRRRNIKNKKKMYVQDGHEFYRKIRAQQKLLSDQEGPANFRNSDDSFYNNSKEFIVNNQPVSSYNI